MQGVKATRIIRYVALPGIVPRVRNLFSSGFGYIAFLMASIYGIVRLLPRNHPYLNPRNIGKFGIRHVVGEAANNLVLSYKNIDQILIFFALLIGIIILLMQIFLLIYGYLIEPAMAMSLFTTEAPERDIAFIMLDRVFGIPEMFNSCVAQGIPCADNAAAGPGFGPTSRFPFHVALHSLLRFYSLGLLFIGMLIFLYFVMVVIGETAISGTPFGQRFQNMWVPVRLVVALGLLVPMHYGLNSGQYIALYAAKFGSGFATNGWNLFTSTLQDRNDKEIFVAVPRKPDMMSATAFMSIAHSCAWSYWHLHHKKDSVSGTPTEGYYTQPYGPGEYRPHETIKPYFVKHVEDYNKDRNAYKLVTETTSYEDGLKFYENSDILIRFGIRDPDNEALKAYEGNVEPTCGEIRISVNAINGDQLNGAYVGPERMQQFYFDQIKSMWFPGASSAGKKIIQLAQRYTAVTIPEKWWLNTNETKPIQCTIACSNGALPSCNNGECETDLPTQDVRTEILAEVTELAAETRKTAWANYVEALQDNFYDFTALKARGWGGAGMLYNKISEVNGALFDAVIKTPSASKMPILMEKVREQKEGSDSSDDFTGLYDPRLAGGVKASISDATLSGDQALAAETGMSNFFKYWVPSVKAFAEDKNVTGVIFSDIMNKVFGTEGLIAMRGENAAVHPLAQLTAVGKGLVNSAVINLFAATAGSTVGGLAEVFGKFFGQAASLVGQYANSIAFLGLTAGFVLFYVLPFLPFVYFFFAVAGWIKGIFEAMVGVPLWALAHLSIDGNGLPGNSATNGYFLIFEIFTRPILTVCGLVASIVIFTAQVRILHFIWPLVVDNLTGYSGYQDNTVMELYDFTIQRDIIDQFFFTVIYTIIVYLLATASFKLIDTIPDNLLRWGGASVSSFNDITGDATEGLTRYVAVGGMTIGQQATGALTKTGQGLGKMIKAEADKLGGLAGNLTKPKT